MHQCGQGTGPVRRVHQVCTLDLNSVFVARLDGVHSQYTIAHQGILAGGGPVGRCFLQAGLVLAWQQLALVENMYVHTVSKGSTVYSISRPEISAELAGR